MTIESVPYSTSPMRRSWCPSDQTLRVACTTEPDVTFLEQRNGWEGCPGRVSCSCVRRMGVSCRDTHPAETKNRSPTTHFPAILVTLVVIQVVQVFACWS